MYRFHLPVLYEIERLDTNCAAVPTPRSVNIAMQRGNCALIGIKDTGPRKRNDTVVSSVPITDTILPLIFLSHK